MTEILYQAYLARDDSVHSGTVHTTAVVDLSHAHQLAADDAGDDFSVSLVQVKLPDGRDLVAEYEEMWADKL